LKNYHCSEYEPRGISFPFFQVHFSCRHIESWRSNPNQNSNKTKSKYNSLGTLSAFTKEPNSNFKNNYSLILNRIYVIALLTSKYCKSLKISYFLRLLHIYIVIRIQTSCPSP
jgi:hypothetical protein